MQKSNTDDYYRDICKNFMNVDISENDKDFISTIMTHGLVSGTQDDRSILAIQELMQRISGLPYDINLYRSGKMHPERRPYISASLSPEIVVVIKKEENTLIFTKLQSSLVLQ